MTGLPAHLGYVAGSAVAALLPLALRGLNPGMDTYTPGGNLFSLFALFQSLVICAVLAQNWRTANRAAPWGAGLLGFVAVSLLILGLITEYSARVWDWLAYEGAAVAVSRGLDPYAEADYLYPPTSAQVGALLVRGLQAMIAWARWPVSHEVLRVWLFYLWQCVQFHVVLACYILTVRLANRMGETGWRWTILVAALYVLNVPLLRGLRFCQPAAWTLLAALLTLLWADRAPWAAALGIAVAAHMKVYPALLLLPALMYGKHRLVTWTVVFAVSIGFVSAVAPGARGYWSSFIDLIRTFPEPIAFRDNSIPSFVRNSARLIGVGPAPHWVLRVPQIAAAVWLVSRLVRRRRGGLRDDFGAWLGSVSDTLCLALVLSPTVWEHYFVFVLPSVLWAFHASRGKRRVAVGIAAVLILGVPVFDAYPLSYHRIAGLLLLIGSSPLRPRGTQLAGFRSH